MQDKFEQNENESEIEEIKKNLLENKIIIPDRRISRILVLKALYQYNFLPEKIEYIGSFCWVNKNIVILILSYSKKLFYGVIRNKEKIDQINKKILLKKFLIKLI